MPCLNEARTIQKCVRQAQKTIEKMGKQCEIIVIDNMSADNSVDLARLAGAQVVIEKEKGYGAAIRAGIEAASGEIVIMGDSDCSYNFSYESIIPFLEACDKGADLVMGNRYKGGIKPGAMPKLHRYFGTPVMSFIVNMLFGTQIGDVNCGLRAFKKDSIKKLHLQSSGMELASEMVVLAALKKMTICEVATTLSPDERNRKPHLRSFRDGFRHLQVWIRLWFGYMLRTYSPVKI